MCHFILLAELIEISELHMKLVFLLKVCFIFYLFIAFFSLCLVPLFDTSFCICSWVVKLPFHMISIQCPPPTALLWLCCQPCVADLLAFYLSSHHSQSKSQLFYRNFLILSPSIPQCQITCFWFTDARECLPHALSGP